MDLISGFPKNLAYTLKALSNFTKQTVKVLPDRVNGVQFGEVTRFRLPASAMIDFRTISIFADVSLYRSANPLAADTDFALHLPRNTNSLIQQLTVTCNGVQLCNINDYNLLYNTLYDLEGADLSQNSKRFLENADPSVYYYSGNTQAANTAIKVLNNTKWNVNNGETKRPIVINNFLGFISSVSTPVIDLNDTGDMIIEIRWSPYTVCWGSAGKAAPNYTLATNAACFFDNIRLTCSKINFENSEYYQLKSQKLLSDGLLIGYYDYWTSRGSVVAKSAGVNMNFNITTNSLDQCIATFQKSDYNTISPLVLHGSATNNADPANTGTSSFNQLLTTQDATNSTITDGSIGDLFNQSYYFMRSGIDLATSQWSINSTNIDPYPLPPSEIFNNNLIALGNNQLDFGASGVHAGCLSLFHFLKYYFCHILSLENLSGDGLMWRSGLNGNGSTININYAATFSKVGANDNTENICPVVFCRSTKVLTIKAGHLISVY